jgi:hypothetical protein
VTVIDWGRYRRCGSCFAEQGKPCHAMTGSGGAPVERDRPCGTRKLRTGYARTGGR